MIKQIHPDSIYLVLLFNLLDELLVLKNFFFLQFWLCKLNKQDQYLTTFHFTFLLFYQKFHFIFKF